MGALVGIKSGCQSSIHLLLVNFHVSPRTLQACSIQNDDRVARSYS